MPHYKNGRPAQIGDRIVNLNPYQTVPAAGILVGIMPGSDTCNATIAKEVTQCVTLGDCLHIDDVEGRPFAPPSDLTAQDAVPLPHTTDPCVCNTTTQPPQTS